MYAHEDDRMIVSKRIQKMSKEQIQKEIKKTEKKWNKQKNKHKIIGSYKTFEEKLAACPVQFH